MGVSCFLSDGSDRLQKRQDDSLDERRMEQPEGRSRRAKEREQPAASAAAQAEPSANGAALDEHRDALDGEVGRGQAVARACRDGDHEFMQAVFGTPADERVLKPRFPRRPQNSASDAARSGASMIGAAFTPAPRQASERR